MAALKQIGRREYEASQHMFMFNLRASATDRTMTKKEYHAVSQWLRVTRKIIETRMN